jgi:uncharacterized protein DUF4184
MPFPLAHPAAILGLRRFCPRHLSFTALVVGTLVPDLGYSFGQPGGAFSHRFLMGTLAFCLPVGMLALLLFYWLRVRIVELLPPRYRKSLSAYCQQPPGSAVILVVSLLIGTWSHLLLDSLTHPDTWMAERLPILLRTVVAVGRHRIAFSALLYAACTLAGVVWLAWVYLCWLETNVQHSVPMDRGYRWFASTVLALPILSVALACRGLNRSLGLVPGALITLGLVSVFLFLSDRRVRSG